MNALVLTAAPKINEHQRNTILSNTCRRIGSVLLNKEPMDGESAAEYKARLTRILRDGVNADVASLTREKNIIEALHFPHSFGSPSDHAANEANEANEAKSKWTPSIVLINTTQLFPENGGAERQCLTFDCPAGWRPWEDMRLELDDPERELKDECDPENWIVIVVVRCAEDGRVARLPLNRTLAETGKYSQQIFGDAYVSIEAENRVTGSTVEVDPMRFASPFFDWAIHGIHDLINVEL